MIKVGAHFSAGTGARWRIMSINGTTVEVLRVDRPYVPLNGPYFWYRGSLELPHIVWE